MEFHDGASYVDVLIKDEVPSKKFNKNQVFWSESHSAYVSVLSHDSEKKQCVCKFHKSSDQAEVAVSTDQLSEKIKVLVSTEAKEQVFSEILVDIRDCVNETLTSLIGCGLDMAITSVMYKGKVISSAVDDTFLDMRVQANDKFAIVYGESDAGSLPQRMWKRFKQCKDYYDYYYVEPHEQDAVIYVAQVDCTITGLLWTKERDEKDTNLKFKYRIDGGDWVELDKINLKHENINQEYNLHFIEFKELGIDFVKLSADSKFEMYVKVCEDSRPWYFYNDEGEEYLKFDDQEPHFKVLESNENPYYSNATRGLFPGVLYTAK